MSGSSQNLDQNPDRYRSLNELVAIMDRLLGPGGCPWDRKQTPQTLAPYAIEEAFELAEALEKHDLAAIKEELGDLLLQVVFHAALAKESGQFSLADVIETICEKLIRRHPHVFEDQKHLTEDQVLTQWEKIKALEKGQVQGPFQIPLSLPALQRAQKIGDKTKKLRFDWATPEQVIEKVREEWSEFEEAYEAHDREHALEELGDLFFVLSQLARHLNAEAESVARAANRKFEARFKQMLKVCETQGKDFSALTDDDKEALWNQIKKYEGP